MTVKNRLIEKLYKGLCSKEELEMLLDLIKEEDPTEASHAEIMALLWEQLEAEPELKDPQATNLIEKTLAKIEQQRPGSGYSGYRRENAKPQVPSRRRFLQRISIAATFLLLIGAVSWLWITSAERVEIHTAYGEQKSIELPDGSVVKLNANSSLSYPKRWNTSEIRQVRLEGEAYFEVRKNQQTGQKFQVVTKDLTVEVLGTVFNVNTRSESTEVFLEEGQVKIDLPEQQANILMVPGELVTYSTKTKIPQKKKVVQEAPASWKTGTALFQGTPLREIIQTFEDIYGIEAVVENASLLDRKFNLGIPVNNLDVAYNVLKELTQLDIEKMGNQLIIK